MERSGRGTTVEMVGRSGVARGLEEGDEHTGMGDGVGDSDAALCYGTVVGARNSAFVETHRMYTRTSKPSVTCS